jgi:hypothetical protein
MATTDEEVRQTLYKRVSEILRALSDGRPPLNS